MCKKILRFFRNNSLSIFFFLLFVITFFASAATGLIVDNEERALHNYPLISYGDYLSKGAFWDAICSNWQAAILQFALLIIFSIFLIQKGAVDSRKWRKAVPEKHKKKIKKRAARLLYENSLSIAFIFLFIATFILHFYFGLLEENEKLALRNEHLISMLDYFLSSRGWFKVFQTCQASFFALFVFIVLSISLRQKGSPESKHVSAKASDTGETYR